MYSEVYQQLMCTFVSQLSDKSQVFIKIIFAIFLKMIRNTDFGWRSNILNNIVQYEI